MAKANIAQKQAHVGNMVKIGKGRTSKIFRKKGNSPSRTSSKGNGARVR